MFKGFIGYSIEWSKESIKFLDKLDRPLNKLITEKVKQLVTEDAKKLDVMPLKGTRYPLFRLVCNSYRIIFSVENNVLIIRVLSIGHRREIYLQLNRKGLL